MSKLILYGILFLVAASIAGCYVFNPTLPEPDRSFVTDKPCAAPCWYGLELSKSTKEDIYATLRQLPFVEQSSIVEIKSQLWRKPTPEIDFDCRNPRIPFCTHLYVEDGVLKQILIALGYDLSLEQVVQKLGVPEYVQIAPNGSAGGTRIALFWPGKLIAVEHINKDERLYRSLSSGSPVPRNLVTDFIYYTSEEHFGLIDAPTRISWPGFEK